MQSATMRVSCLSRDETRRRRDPTTEAAREGDAVVCSGRGLIWGREGRMATAGGGEASWRARGEQDVRFDVGVFSRRSWKWLRTGAEVPILNV